jgi:hypothetical protein
MAVALLCCVYGEVFVSISLTGGVLPRTRVFYLVNQTLTNNLLVKCKLKRSFA